jgi:hypothetical protein
VISPHWFSRSLLTRAEPQRSACSSRSESASHTRSSAMRHCGAIGRDMIRNIPTDVSRNPQACTARRILGSGSSFVSNSKDDISEIWLRGNLCPEEIADEVGIRKCQKCAKCAFSLFPHHAVIVIQEISQQDIKLARATSALPSEPGVAQCLLSASIFLVSAMALAGLSPFGQVLVQFMIVWQRYRRNGSSRSSSRSPRASSLLSTSQR